jgi:hypothetical protein
MPVPPEKRGRAEKRIAHREGIERSAPCGRDAPDRNETDYGSQTEQRADDRGEGTGGNREGQEHEARRHYHEATAGRVTPIRVEGYQAEVGRMDGGSGHGRHVTEEV